MTRARNKKEFRKRRGKKTFNPKDTAVALRRTGHRRKARCRLLGGTNRGNYLGFAIGIAIGIALFTFLFLSASTSENGDSGDEHASGNATNAAGSGPWLVHE